MFGWYAVFLARLILIAFVSTALAVLTACGVPGTERPVPVAAGMPGPSPSSTAAVASVPGWATSTVSAPSPSQPAVPGASPVAVAGWQTGSSEHWVGYTFAVSGVTGVRAQWTEPSVRGSAGSEEYVWVGIGGIAQTEQNIIQAGTFSYLAAGGLPDEGAWYELVPALPRYAMIGVGRADEIEASVVQVEPGRPTWQVSVADLSNGQSFTRLVRYRSLGAFPDFVVEDPDKGPPSAAGPFVPFPDWRAVSFANMAIRIAGEWKPAASIFGDRLAMIRDGRTLATAGPLDARSGFTAWQETA